MIVNILGTELQDLLLQSKRDASRELPLADRTDLALRQSHPMARILLPVARMMKHFRASGVAACLLASALLVSGPLVAQGASNVCVGPSASGNGTGSDWSNMAAWSSANLSRGNTYYLASGTYGSKTFSSAASGSTVITIRKAIESDHGAAAGWNAAYGTGQAIISASLTFTSPYWVLDGQTGGGPANWETGHGIRIAGNNGIVLNDVSGVNHVTVQHVEFLGNGINSGCAFGFKLLPYTYGSSFWTIRYCYFHNMSSTALECQRLTDVLWEYNYVADSPSYGSCHGEHIFALDAQRHVYRFSRWAKLGAGGTGFIMVGGSDFKIYGNELWDGPQVQNGVIAGWGSYSVANAQVYNNTMVNCVGVMSGGINFQNDGGGNVIRDNLIVNCQNGSVSGGTASNNTIDNNTSRFLNYSARDLRLTGALAGTSLPLEFNTDMMGNTRAADGTWDIGAYEYGGALTNALIGVTPSSWDFGSVATGTTNRCTLTVQNKGGGILGGNATVSAPFSIVSGGTYSLGSSQSQVVTVQYTPTSVGTNTGAVSFTGGGGFSASVKGSAQAVLVPTPPGHLRVVTSL